MVARASNGKKDVKAFTSPPSPQWSSSPARVGWCLPDWAPPTLFSASPPYDLVDSQQTWRFPDSVVSRLPDLSFATSYRLAMSLSSWCSHLRDSCDPSQLGFN